MLNKIIFVCYRSFSFGKFYAGDASEIIVLTVGSAVGGLLLLLILVTVIAISVCLVMKLNKRKASNSSSNIHQSNTQIHCMENEVFNDSGSVTTHSNAAYKTSQPPLADRLDVVYDSADMITQHSSRNREDSTMIFDAHEAYDSSNFLLYPRVTNDTVTEQSTSQRERDSILKVQLNEAYESSNFPVFPNVAYELLNPQDNTEDANYYVTVD